jgi:hypothetical protein
MNVIEPPGGNRADTRSILLREDLSRWLFGADRAQRFTQDSPILPEVWFRYGEASRWGVDLLLTPEAHTTAAQLARMLDEALDGHSARLAYNESYVAVTLGFRDLIHHTLPLSSWWQTRQWAREAPDLATWVVEHRDELLGHLRRDGGIDRRGRTLGEAAWFVAVVGRVALGARTEGTPEPDEIVGAAAELLHGLGSPPEAEPSRHGLLWRVNVNRSARTALYRSRRAIKADAVQRVFDVSCVDLCWAVIDSGIDATHPAFARRGADERPLAEDPFDEVDGRSATRVRATYDFTRLRTLLAGQLPEGADPWAAAQLEHLRDRLRNGRAIDWDRLEPLLRVPHARIPLKLGGYRPPVNEHGTHVAGILAGDWRADDPDMPSEHELRGICPDIDLYDLRVFDDSGAGEEFVITAALQFVRHLNAHSDLQVIHGANMSLSIDHDVRNYACGRTPVCDEAERLSASGVVVVTAAGNEGRTEYVSDRGTVEGYRTASITDPGNAEHVITVGATHRFEPHTYGVSYFSSRGPTGDGRHKPDLVAPGEKIEAPVPDRDSKVKDGTSQAAPHVSGAAALLMARHEELRGQPARIKEVLCASATDLGRERYFQGAGMVDVLRAMQAV